MDIYKQLNQLTAYIEEHVEDELHPDVLIKFLHTNVYTAGKIFSVLAGQTFSEYVRRRRLSLAGQDLYINHPRIVDLAVKYGYDNATAFSRAFEKFHGIKPSQVTETTKLKNFPRLTFDENPQPTTPLDYGIITLPTLSLSGVGIDTNNTKIPKDAPRFFQQIIKKYVPIHGPVKYGAILYEPTRQESQQYFCLWDQDIPGFQKLQIPASKWLKFTIDSIDAPDIQAVSQQFYREFLPSSKYTLRELPELEYYHDGITDFLVAIE